MMTQSKLFDVTPVVLWAEKQPDPVKAVLEIVEAAPVWLALEIATGADPETVKQVADETVTRLRNLAELMRRPANRRAA